MLPEHTQVLQVTFVTLTRKAGATAESALADVEDLAKWPVFQVDVRAIRAAGQLVKQAQVSFWDALMVVAAGRMGAGVLLTEDLNDGQIIGSVRVENPFR